MELNYKIIQKLSIICYNLNFGEFKKIFKKAANLPYADDEYLKEKFIVMQREGLDFLCRLDEETAKIFFNELLKKFKKVKK